MFGGLLFSSGTVLCKTKTMSEDKFKRKFEQQYGRRAIRFHNIPEKITKEPSSVLQQENNDVVDAVRKEYQDLPQYQPVSGLAGNIAGLLGQTCVVNISKPEVRDTGVSPIHSTTKEYTSDYENPSYQDKDSDIERVSKDDCAQRNPTASSGIGTNSPESYEVDSLEEYPVSEYDSLNVHEGEIYELRGGHSTTPSIDRGVYCGGRSSVLQLESAPSTFCVKGCYCPIHRTEADKMKTQADNPTRLTWGDVAQNAYETQARGNVTCSDMIRPPTPHAEISGSLNSETIRKMNQSPLKRMDLEKWLNDVEESRSKDGKVCAQAFESPDEETGTRWRDTREKENFSSRRRMRAPLQESLQLLKKLQFVPEEDLSLEQNSVHRGGRASCLKTVRAPSSLCLGPGNCQAHCEFEMTSGQSNEPVSPIELKIEAFEGSSDNLTSEHQLATSRTEHIAKGGRQSSLNLLRASSGMCIHGPSCRVHCQKMGMAKMVTECENQTSSSEKFSCKLKDGCKPKLHSELQELRGASVFGEAHVSPKYNTLEDQGISNRTVEQSCSVNTESKENELRGASIFGDFSSVRNQKIIESGMRGASSFAVQPPREFNADHSCGKEANNSQSYLGEIRGASCFAPLDESIAGTSSVTLSFAIESDAESFFADKSLVQRKRTAPVIEKRNAVDCKFKSKLGKKYQILDDRRPIANALEKRDFLRQRRNSNDFDERILKVGKDTAIMSTLLNALRRDGEKRKQLQMVEISKHDGDTNRLDLTDTVTIDKEDSIGNLKLSVLYRKADSATPLLYVSILGLEVMLKEIVSPEYGIYVKVCLSPKFATWRRTRILNVSESLVLKDHFVMSGVKPIDLEEAILRFVVVRVGEDEKPIGQLEVPLEELKSRDKFKRTYALRAPTYNAKDDGTDQPE